MWDAVQEGNAEEAAYQAAKLKERLIVDVDIAFPSEMRLKNVSAGLHEQLENRAKVHNTDGFSVVVMPKGQSLRWQHVQERTS